MVSLDVATWFCGFWLLALITFIDLSMLIFFFFLFCYLEVLFVYLKIALFWNSAWFGCDGLSSVLWYNMLIGLNISRLTFLDFMLAEISRTGILNCSNRWVPWLYSVHNLSYISVMFCSFKYIIYILNFYKWVSLPSDSWNVFVTWMS